MLTDSKKIKFRSNFEKAFATNLTKRGIPFEYEPFELTYYIKKKGKCKTCGSTDIVEVHKYTPDFKIGEMLIETKGKLDSKTRTKMKAVLDCNPNRDIRFIFMFDNWLTKQHKKRYSTWCEDTGFKFDFMQLPKCWSMEATGVNN